jgi:hypothetical protein
MRVFLSEPECLIFCESDTRELGIRFSPGTPTQMRRHAVDLIRPPATALATEARRTPPAITPLTRRPGVASPRRGRLAPRSSRHPPAGCMRNAPTRGLPGVLATRHRLCANRALPSRRHWDRPVRRRPTVEAIVSPALLVAGTRFQTSAATMRPRFALRDNWGRSYPHAHAGGRPGQPRRDRAPHPADRPLDLLPRRSPRLNASPPDTTAGRSSSHHSGTCSCSGPQREPTVAGRHPTQGQQRRR